MFSDRKKRKTTDDFTKEQNKIAEGTTLVGDIKSKGSFRIDGEIKGNIELGGKVVIGEKGYVHGDLKCSNADIAGKYRGNLTVENSLVLKSTSDLDGEITTGELLVEPGANINGTCSMNGAVKSLNNGGGKRSEKRKEQSA